MSYAIEMVRGTTSPQQIRIMQDGVPYFLSDDELIRFGVKEAGHCTRFLINKVFKREHQDPETGMIDFKIEPQETIGWPIKTYKYDIGLQSGNDYFIIIPESDFKVKQNITAYEVV